GDRGPGVWGGGGRFAAAASVAVDASALPRRLCGAERDRTVPALLSLLLVAGNLVSPLRRRRRARSGAPGRTSPTAPAPRRRGRGAGAARGRSDRAPTRLSARLR